MSAMLKPKAVRSIRARAFILGLAAECLQQDFRNPKLIEDVRNIASEMKRDGRGCYSEDDQRRIDQQRTLFNMLPTCSQRTKLKEAMCQRAYDKLWDGDTEGCDALLEFLPSDDVTAILDAWGRDVDPNMSEKDRSAWYHRA